MVTMQLSRSEAYASSTTKYPRRHMSAPALPWVVLGTCIGLLLSTVLRIGGQQTPTKLVAPRGQLDSALWQQGFSHISFHDMNAKSRLAGLVRKHSIACVVGVEHGEEVVRLAQDGFKVHAFEPMRRFHSRLDSILKSNSSLDVQLYKVAAGESNGMLKLSYMKEASEKVKRGRIDDFVSGELDLLSIDIQGSEVDAMRGARRLMESTKVRSLWLEIFSCNPKVRPLLHILDSYDYVVFDFVPWGMPNTAGAKLSSLHEIPNAAGFGLNKRPARFDEYYKWMCDVRNKHYKWLQSDVLAIRRDLVTPELMLRLRSLGNDLFAASVVRAKLQRRS